MAIDLHTLWEIAKITGCFVILIWILKQRKKFE